MRYAPLLITVALLSGCATRSIGPSFSDLPTSESKPVDPYDALRGRHLVAGDRFPMVIGLGPKHDARVLLPPVVRSPLERSEFVARRPGLRQTPVQENSAGTDAVEVHGLLPQIAVAVFQEHDRKIIEQPHPDLAADAQPRAVVFEDAREFRLQHSTEFRIEHAILSASRLQPKCRALRPQGCQAVLCRRVKRNPTST